MNTNTRRNFLGKASIFTCSLIGLPSVITASNNSQKDTDPLHANFPGQDPKLVQEIVGASHGRIDKVKELLTAHPELAKAAWDWGFGDWETALGAASHVGNKDIADLLIAHGARPDIFTFAMFGNLNAVKGILEKNGDFQKILGPHGITLLAHAKSRLTSKSISEAEKEEIQKVVDYLIMMGDADIKPINLGLSEEAKFNYVGNYSYGPNPSEILIVEKNAKGALTIKKGETAGRGLFRVEDHGFSPVGAPHVTIRFEMVEGKASVLTLHDPMPMLKGIRIN